MVTRLLLLVVVALLLVLHQDFWFWRTARALVFGFLPVGLAYHAAYCLAAALLVWLLTSMAWPHHLEGAEPASSGERARAGVGPRELL